MVEVWSFRCLVWWILALIEITSCQPSLSPDDSEHLSLKKLKTLMDAEINQEYVDSYQGFMRAGRAPIDGPDDGRLQSGRHLDVFNDETVHEPRHTAQQRSASRRRRARSQALRRDKLNSQGLRSHQHHTRRALPH